MSINRLNKNLETDCWLTPPELLKLLGKFDLDLCCPEYMPWRTAKKMVHRPFDGFAVPWKGRVFCNPPYSDPYPWVNKMSLHHNGIMLLPAKSPETRWGQLALDSCDAVLFLKGRLLFHKNDGTLSLGKWGPNMLLAFGPSNARKLDMLISDGKLEGILFDKNERGL